MNDQDYHLPKFIEKMEGAGLGPAVIETFSHYYRQVVAGETGLMSERDIMPIPPEAVETADALENFRDAGQDALQYI